MRGELRPDSEAALANLRCGRGPLIVHVIFRLDVGGLENGLVNLINRIPEDRFRHAIVCLTHYSDFRRRIRRNDVPVFALNKPPGNSPMTRWRALCPLRWRACPSVSMASTAVI
jgi:hypothetical protein